MERMSGLSLGKKGYFDKVMPESKVSRFYEESIRLELEKYFFFLVWNPDG